MLPQHIRHNKESHMAAANIHLVQMRHAAVARGDCDIFELDVHVILGWEMSALSLSGV